MLYKFGKLEDISKSLKEGYIYMNEFHNFKDHGEKIINAMYFKGDKTKFDNLLIEYIEFFYFQLTLKSNEKIEKSDLDNIVEFRNILIKYQGENICKIVDFLSEQENGVCLYCFFYTLQMTNIVAMSVFFPIYIVDNLNYFDFWKDRVTHYLDNELQKFKTEYMCDKSAKCYHRDSRQKYEMLDIIWDKMCLYAKYYRLDISKKIWKNMFDSMYKHTDIFCRLIIKIKKDFFYSACCFTANAYDDLKMYDDYGDICLVLEPIKLDNKFYFEVSRDGINFTLEEIHKVNYGINADYFNFLDSPKKEDILKYHSIKDESYQREKEYRVICKTSEIKDKKLYINFEKHLKKVVFSAGSSKFCSGEEYGNFCNVLKEKTKENHNLIIEVYHMIVMNKSKHIHKAFTISKCLTKNENGDELINMHLHNKKMYEDLIVN